MKMHLITKEEYEEVKKVAKTNKNKRIDKRLQVIILRYEGLKDREIAEKLDYSRKRISQLCAEFKQVGLEVYAKSKYVGNHKNLTYEEEKEILDTFEERANNGEIITAKEIKEAFDKKLGRVTDKSYIYRVFKRHNYRKVKPRPRHPKKASQEEVDSSKKLTKL